MNILDKLKFRCNKFEAARKKAASNKKFKFKILRTWKVKIANVYPGIDVGEIMVHRLPWSHKLQSGAIGLELYARDTGRKRGFTGFGIVRVDAWKLIVSDNDINNVSTVEELFTIIGKCPFNIGEEGGYRLLRAIKLALSLNISNKSMSA